jgi:hypothetical protein
MSPRQRSATQHAKARPRWRRQGHERLERDRRHAPQAAAALPQALAALGRPAHLGVEREGR